MHSINALGPWLWIKIRYVYVFALAIIFDEQMNSSDSPVSLALRNWFCDSLNQYRSHIRNSEPTRWLFDEKLIFNTLVTNSVTTLLKTTFSFVFIISPDRLIVLLTNSTLQEIKRRIVVKDICWINTYFLMFTFMYVNTLKINMIWHYDVSGNLVIPQEKIKMRKMRAGIKTFFFSSQAYSWAKYAILSAIIKFMHFVLGCQYDTFLTGVFKLSVKDIGKKVRKISNMWRCLKM
jgi:hypothetical protein